MPVNLDQKLLWCLFILWFFLGCPSGWVNGWSVNLGCLKFDSTAASYSNSKTLCTSLGASYPVEIFNQDQQDFIKSYANSLVSAGTIAGTHGWWIGNIYSLIYVFS